MRVCETTLDDVLSIISCAHDYGHNNEVAMGFFAEIIGKRLTDKELQEFAASFLTEESRSQGYGEEDAEQVTETLQEFRSRYCK